MYTCLRLNGNSYLVTSINTLCVVKCPLYSNLWNHRVRNRDHRTGCRDLFSQWVKRQATPTKAQILSSLHQLHNQSSRTHPRLPQEIAAPNFPRGSQANERISKRETRLFCPPSKALQRLKVIFQLSFPFRKFPRLPSVPAPRRPNVQSPIFWPTCRVQFLQSRGAKRHTQYRRPRRERGPLYHSLCHQPSARPRRPTLLSRLPRPKFLRPSQPQAPYPRAKFTNRVPQRRTNRAQLLCRECRANSQSSRESS